MTSLRLASDHIRGVGRPHLVVQRADELIVDGVRHHFHRFLRKITTIDDLLDFFGRWKVLCLFIGQPLLTPSKKLIKNSDAPELLVKEPQVKRKRMKNVLFCRVPGCELKNFRFKTKEALRSHTIRKRPLPEEARTTAQEEDWVIVPCGEETKLSAQEALLFSRSSLPLQLRRFDRGTQGLKTMRSKTFGSLPVK